MEVLDGVVSIENIRAQTVLQVMENLPWSYLAGVTCRDGTAPLASVSVFYDQYPASSQDDSKQHVFETAAPTANAPDPDTSPCVCLCTILWIPVQTPLAAAALWFAVLLQLRDLSAQV